VIGIWFLGFNLHRTLKEKAELPLIVVEGFFDVIKLWQLGHRKSVAIMGSSMSDAQEELLREAASIHRTILVILGED